MNFVWEVLRSEFQLQSQHILNEEPKAFVVQPSEESALLAPRGQRYSVLNAKAWSCDSEL